MGLFSNAKELNRLANGVSLAKQSLDLFERDPDATWILVAAWVCKRGIIDIIERNKWPIYYIFYVEIDGHMTKMTISEGLMCSVSRLKIKLEKIHDLGLKRQVEDVLDGGYSLDELEDQIPDYIRMAIIDD